MLHLGSPLPARLVPYGALFLHAVAPPKEDVLVTLNGEHVTLVDAAERGQNGWVRHHLTADDRLNPTSDLTVDVGRVEFWVQA